MTNQVDGGRESAMRNHQQQNNNRMARNDRSADIIQECGERRAMGNMPGNMPRQAAVQVMPETGNAGADHSNVMKASSFGSEIWAKAEGIVLGGKAQVLATCGCMQEFASTRFVIPVADFLTSTKCKVEDFASTRFVNPVSQYFSSAKLLVQDGVSTIVTNVQFARTALVSEINSARCTVTSYVDEAITMVSDSYMAFERKGLRVWTLETGQATAVTIKESLAKVSDETCKKTRKVMDTAHQASSDPSIRAATVGASAGAAACGTAGGTVGLASGAVMGAVVGLGPALFTFGASVPIGAMLGGGTGLMAGASLGSMVGFIGGGATGYGVYSRGDQIKEIASKTKCKVNDGAEFMKDKASASKDWIGEKASSVRVRFVGGGTGSTEDVS